MIQQKFMVSNDCYVANKKITPKGIMVHSTATPGVMADRWFSLWNRPGIEVCVHAFVDDVKVCQYLPWNHRAWHAGGKANDTHIGIEMCEPTTLTDPAYFGKVWTNTVNLVASLCKEYNLTSKDIIDHSEGHRRGIASNHADVSHWFPKMGKTMEDFRMAVENKLNNSDQPSEWAKIPIEWAKANGISDGSRPKDTCTREELITMLYRAHQKKLL